MPQKSNAANALTTTARDRLAEMGGNIRKARTRRGITQKDLALRTSVSPVTIGKLEKGDPTVGLSVLAMALDVLGLVDDITLLANPNTDSTGKALEEARPVKRVQKRSRSKNLDF
ncbi:helix-turn-helix domain-containing protein [Pseudodesulfovibrio pelocollis]|uniref:helix-turn-helix domain-containing protein n=1 Tax=Pseudodesulfovibrio pelocollis TaxID=3051432 RepID=UPI00255B1F71|nr:helix-turn-helix transcriptional regulator [Pseudodesulfovibrio sp. SB368]